MTATNQIPGTYGGGMTAIIIFIFGVLIAICALDLASLLQDRPSIGYRVQKWSRRNPLYAAGLLLVLCTLLGHFLLNNIKY
jgi:multisubunit Na+/H+ antiporter MnhB subunit